MIYRYDGKIFSKFGEKEIPDWVFYMEEDNAGTLWFVLDRFGNNKDGGAISYDGKSFTNFTMTDDFCYKSPWCVVMDRKGDIWFTNRDKSLCRYDGKNFTSFSE
jgi:streptogramin lyase